MTSQSDFFRLQFRGFARIEGSQWQHYANDDARFHTTYNCAWVRVDHPSRSVTFGPKNGVNCTEAFAGQGWTPFCLPRPSAWVKGIYPDYAINPGHDCHYRQCQRRRKAASQCLLRQPGFPV
jgi:hypothetical protein